jgi:hypothetical protein
MPTHLRLALLLLAVAPVFGQTPPSFVPDKPPVFAQTLELKGIVGAEVLIEELDVGSVQLGIAPESVRTDVELRLREAGFGVLPPDVRPAHPLMDLIITSTANGQATMIQLQLGEMATTVREPTITTIPVTWSHAVVIARPTADGVRASVKDCVDRFLNEWLATNPRENSGNPKQYRKPGVSLAIHHE